MNPFKKGTSNGVDFSAVSAADRIEMVNTFTAQQCVAAIELPYKLQKTVYMAIRRRINALKVQGESSSEIKSK